MPRASRLTAAAVCLSAGLASPLSAQSTTRPFLVFEHAGMAGMLTDERDQGLREALAMLPERVGELPQEIEDMPHEAVELMQLFLRTAARPARMAVVYDGDNPSGGFFGYGMIASIDCTDRGQVERLQEAVLGIGEMLEEEQGIALQFRQSERFDHMREMMLPFGTLAFGPREAENGWRYELMIGTVNEPDEIFAGSPDIIDERGFQTFATAQVDFSTLTPLSRIVTNLAADAGPIVTEVTGGLEEMGLLGEEAMVIDFQSGVTDSMSISRTIVRGAAARAETLHLPTTPLSAEELRAIPADALAASIGRADMDSLKAMLDQMSGYGLPVEAGLDAFEEQTGVDFVEELLEPLGGTFAFYTADSTGGGSLFSAVMMMTIEDQEKFSGAVHKLSLLANEVIMEEGDMPARYVYLDSWTDGSGAELITLRFPGLPVPLELTLAFTDDWFIAAATPQAAVAAARQASGRGDDGLPSNPRFASIAAEQGEGATSVSFIDTPRTIRSGYGVLTLLGSAVSNAMRSPHDPELRTPGMIVPLYGELVNGGTVPMVKISRWQGEDLVTTTYNDRSVWVQAGGAMGAASAALPLIGLGVAGAAVAAERQDFVSAEWPEQPMALVDHARRRLWVDPVAEMSAALIAVPRVREAAESGLDVLRGR